MKICVSISPASAREACNQLARLSRSEDLIELRVDNIPDLDLEAILKGTRPEIILTNRAPDNGGQFNGTINDRLSIFERAISLGAEYIDVEFSLGDKIVRGLISGSKKTKVICSYHNFEKTVPGLKSIYESIRTTNAPVIKIATMANAITDNKIILDLLRYAGKVRQKTIAFCMGEYGEFSRIAGGIYGNYIAFASLSDDKSTGPGQLSREQMKNLFRADLLSKKSKLFGLVGNPVKQSQGIIYHNNRFARAGVNAVYANFLVGDLRSFLNSFEDLITGLSITMPFKKEAVSFVDAMDEQTGYLGVLNTIIKKRGKLVGSNSDLSAALSILKKRIRPRNRMVTVLGAGATARTLAYAAILNGGHVTIAGRDTNKAKSLAGDLCCNWTTFENLTDLKCDLLINATSAGMTGNNDSAIVPKKLLRRKMTVLDAVYNPIMTRLLTDALSAGCQIVTGMELFKRQAQIQSKLFFECIG